MESEISDDFVFIIGNKTYSVSGTSADVIVSL